MMMTGYAMRENNSLVDVSWSATPGKDGANMRADAQ